MRKAKSSRFKDSCGEETALRNAQRSSVTRLSLLDRGRLSGARHGSAVAQNCVRVNFREKVLKESPQALAEFNEHLAGVLTPNIGGRKWHDQLRNGRRSMPRSIAIYKTMPAIVRFVPSF